MAQPEVLTQRRSPPQALRNLCREYRSAARYDLPVLLGPTNTVMGRS